MGYNFGIEIGGTGFSFGKGDSVSGKNYKRSREHAVVDVGRRIVSAADGARNAGLHPLFALGSGQGGGSTPVPVGGTTSTSISGQAPSKIMREQEQALLEETRARTRFINAQAQELFDSRWAFEDAKSARARQALTARQDETKIRESEYSGMKLPGGAIVSQTEGADAQDYENRWWEFGGAAGGLINLGGDATANLPPDFWDYVIDKWNSERGRAKKFKSFGQFIKQYFDSWTKYKNSKKGLKKQPKGTEEKPGYYKEMYKGKAPGKYYSGYKSWY